MMNLYAIRDVKADNYMALHPVVSDVLAQRALAEALEAGNSNLSRYPEDYQLYQVGSWDEVSGELISLKVPKFICSVTDLAKMVRDRALKQAADKAAFEKRMKEQTGVSA